MFFQGSHPKTWSAKITVTPEILEQFDRINQWNPRVQALLEWDETAAQQRAQRSLKHGGELAGWSLAVKDIIDVAGAPTRCNADFMPASPARKDATIVTSLVDQGAFIAAKAVTTTFAFFDPGPTRNPWNLQHTPGGSSSGSAAAVACGMVRLALGSQTVASVNRPASYCGVVGFKPTYGRLPTEGVFPFSPTVDTIGTFTRNVADVQIVWTALTKEPAVQQPSQLNIAVVIDQGGELPEPVMLDEIQVVTAQLKAAGHQLTPLTLDPVLQQAHKNHRDLISYEAAQVHTDLFARHKSDYTPKLRELIQHGQSVRPAQLERILAHRMKSMEVLARYLENHDLLLSPSAPGPAPATLKATGNPRMSLLWAYTGFPTLTLPASLTEARLPLGIQLVGRRGADRELLAAGAMVEEVLGFNKQPSLSAAQ